MELDAFLKERAPRWDLFERALDRAGELAAWELDPARIQELVTLYRLTCSDLNQVRSLTANPTVLDRLDQLTGRGYRFIYGHARREGLRAAVARLFFSEISLAFRREARFVACAAAAMLVGIIFGMVAVLVRPEYAPELVPEMFYTESPRERVERIESGEERIDSVEEAVEFGASLFVHNIQVSFLAFGLGALTIAGGWWILFYNGVILGAVTAQYLRDGLATFFVAWVGPHGALELPAIVFAGAAGLRAGWALLLPGERSVGSSLRDAFPSVQRILIATSVILVFAGLIEGGFSQFSAKTVPYTVKIASAVILFVLMLCYLYVPRRRAGSKT